MRYPKALLGLFIAMGIWAGCERHEGQEAQTGEAKAIQAPTETNLKTYQVDVNASLITFIGAKVTGKHENTVKLKNGEFAVNQEGLPVQGKFTIDMTTIENLDLKGQWKEKFLGHLRSPDFFDVEKYPEAYFEIASSEKKDTTILVTGNLTLKDSTKSITFPIQIKEESGKIRINAFFSINRQLWGITYPGKPDDLIKDMVDIKLDLVGVPKAEETQNPS
jgi:polyisoprenoid-binding protein YceI